MSWREQYTQATFRGVEFHVKAAPLEGGRRVVLHQYPRRDLPYPEDMGRQARRYQFEAVLLGAEYFAARDRLLSALEQAGPGPLNHPYFGRLQVQILRFQCRQSTAEGGLCWIDIECHEAGAAAQPEAKPDTGAAVEVAADDAEDAEWAEWENLNVSVEDVSSTWDQAMADIAEARHTLATVAMKVNTWLGEIQVTRNKIASLIAAPADIAQSVFSAVGGLRNIASSPLGALQAYRGLFEYGRAVVTPPAASPAEQARVAKQQALRALVRSTAAIAAARTVAAAQPYRYLRTPPARPPYPATRAATATQPYRYGGPGAERTALLAAPDQPGFATWQEAVTARDQVQAALQAAMLEADDASYAALRDLSAALAAHVNAQRGVLGCGGRYTAGAALPSLLLAQRIYGDATRAAELEQRNHVRHPGFVPGGTPLEIIQWPS